MKLIVVLICITTLLIQYSFAQYIEKVYVLDNAAKRTYKRSFHATKRQVPLTNITSFPTTDNFTSFNMDITCVNSRIINGISICTWIQTAITSMLQRISKVIYLPVTVNVFCTVAASSNSSVASTILASAAPTRMIQVSSQNKLQYL